MLKQIITVVTALILGFAAPITLYVVLRNKNKLVDLDASIKEERTLPFSISIGLYLIGLVVMILFSVNIVTIAFWFCYISNTLLTIFINKRWKISAHSMGAAGPGAAMFYVFGLPALLFLIIVFLVGWSRIQLKCHTIGQVIVGIVLAFVSTYLQIFFIVKIFNN